MQETKQQEEKPVEKIEEANACFDKECASYQSMFEDFQKIQKSMPVIGRNKTGDTGGRKYKYADIDKIWEIANPIIAANNFIVTHEVTAEGVKTIAIHSSGEKLESLISYTKTDKPQDMGKIITYYRRYNICAIFNIIVADEDDDGKVPPKDFEKPDIDVRRAIAKLRSAKSFAELQIFWSGLTQAERGNQAIEAAKNDLKSILK